MKPITKPGRNAILARFGVRIEASGAMAEETYNTMLYELDEIEFAKQLERAVKVILSRKAAGSLLATEVHVEE